MGIVAGVGKFFRGLHDGWETVANRIDPYKLYGPITTTIEHTRVTLDALNREVESNYILFGWGNITRGKIMRHDDAAKSYAKLVEQLPSGWRQKEAQQALAGVRAGLTAILRNLQAMETNFTSLFGAALGKDKVIEIRTSTLILLGYIEQANTLNHWIGTLIEILTAKHPELVPPFWTKTMKDGAAQVGQFLSLNLDRWNPDHGGLINDIRQIQKKGSDVLVKTGNSYIDDYVSDHAFSDGQGTLMNAALRNPFLMFASGSIARENAAIQRDQARKDWLVAKVQMAEAKLRGEEEGSPEYKRLEKLAANYMDLVNKYEQKIERMRV